MEGAPREYIIQLRQILVDRFNEGELRTLCHDLGVNYGTLPGEGRADKARELIKYLERRERLPELVEIGKHTRPDILWSDIPADIEVSERRKKYYVASSLSENEIVAKFDITSDNFARTTRFEEAYLVVFDLSCPPDDWLKYVGGKAPFLPFIVFVALDGITTTLDGKDILGVIRSCYGYSARVWKEQTELLNALTTAEYAMKTAEQIERAARRMAIAGKKGTLW